MYGLPGLLIYLVPPTLGIGLSLTLLLAIHYDKTKALQKYKPFLIKNTVDVAVLQSCCLGGELDQFFLFWLWRTVGANVPSSSF